MIFVTGPLFAGKRDYIRCALGMEEAEFAAKAVWDVQDLAAEATDLQALAEALAQKEIVIATEVGGGVIPVDAGERHAREAAGRLACLLAGMAETAIRVQCGLPQILKGNLPC